MFSRGVGESTDVVTKEMYDFEDKGGRRIALRPEGTAGVVRAFVELFDRLWAASTTVDDGVDTTSERLVELMQAGLKDEAIARVLGVSLRTVRRRIAALMDECDVETRFQLAVELTERGIVGSGQRRSSGA